MAGRSCCSGRKRVQAGDPLGVADIERGIEIASAAGSLGVLSVAYNSLAVARQMLGELDAGYDARLAGARVAGKFGSARELRWFDGVLSDHHYRKGEWDEALRLADGFLAEVDAGASHYLTWQVAAIRAEIRVARGDTGGAIADVERALEGGRAVGDPQAVYFVLPACAHVFALASELERALPLGGEYLDALRRGDDFQFAVINLPTFAAAARRLGLADELGAALEGRAATRWTDAVGTYTRGEFARAADILDRIGARPEAAEARLRAGEQHAAAGRAAEAEEQLQRALVFYRSVGAASCLGESEALLSASG